MTNTYVVGIASAFPPYTYTQDQMKDAFLHNNIMSDKDRDFTERVFKATQIETCRSFLSKDMLFKCMNREEYILYIKHSLRTLAISAVEKAVSEWGGKIEDITHIIWGTMTGCIYAPTMDVELIQALGLSPYTKRLNIENMGCLTGFRCLALASSLAKESERNRVLVVVGDIRSALGNQFSPEFNRSNVIVGSLFRDSCAACIVSQEKERAIFKIVGHESAVIPNTFDLVKYSEKNGGYISLDISKDLPSAIADSLPSLVERLLPKDIHISSCDIVCHTGGPRILNTVRDCLQVSDDHLSASWYVMKHFGNLSGSSNLVVLDHQRIFGKRDDIVCISMGPGLGVETLYLQRV